MYQVKYVNSWLDIRMKLWWNKQWTQMFSWPRGKLINHEKTLLPERMLQGQDWHKYGGIYFKSCTECVCVCVGRNAGGNFTCTRSWWPGQSSCHRGSRALSPSSCCLREPWLEVGGMLEFLSVKETSLKHPTWASLKYLILQWKGLYQMNQHQLDWPPLLNYSIIHVCRKHNWTCYIHFITFSTFNNAPWFHLLLWKFTQAGSIIIIMKP